MDGWMDLIALRLHDTSYVKLFLRVGQQGKGLNGATANGLTGMFQRRSWIAPPLVWCDSCGLDGWWLRLILSDRSHSRWPTSDTHRHMCKCTPHHSSLWLAAKRCCCVCVMRSVIRDIGSHQLCVCFASTAGYRMMISLSLSLSPPTPLSLTLSFSLFPPSLDGCECFTKLYIAWISSVAQKLHAELYHFKMHQNL